jgi:hypothetical protein
MLDEPHHPIVDDVVKKTLMSASSIQFTALPPMTTASESSASCCPGSLPLRRQGPEPVGEADEVLIVDRIENLDHGALDARRVKPKACWGL